MRCIDADALIEDIDGDLTDSVAEGRAIEKIMNAPTIEPERKVGKWKHDADGLVWCDTCGFGKKRSDDRLYRFCPNCGGRMEEGERDG